MRSLIVLFLLLSSFNISAQTLTKKELLSELDKNIRSNNSLLFEFWRFDESLDKKKDLLLMIIDLYDLSIDTNEADIRTNGAKAHLNTAPFYSGLRTMNEKQLCDPNSGRLCNSLVDKFKEEIIDYRNLTNTLVDGTYSKKVKKAAQPLVIRSNEIINQLTGQLTNINNTTESLCDIYFYINEQINYLRAQMDYTDWDEGQHGELSDIENYVRKEIDRLDKQINDTKELDAQAYEGLVKARTKFFEARKKYRSVAKEEN